MSYDTPTLDDFIARFPEFIETSPAKINFALSDAARNVDNSWIEADYAYAIMLLVAHLLTARAFIAANSGAVEGAIRSESIGRISVTYADAVASPSETDVSTTAYGQMYDDLRALNHPAILVVA